MVILITTTITMNFIVYDFFIFPPAFILLANTFIRIHAKLDILLNFYVYGFIYCVEDCTVLLIIMVVDGGKWQ